jgi:hypothetical protein
MIQWLRVVLPVLYYLPLFIMVQGVATAVVLYFEWRLQMPLRELRLIGGLITILGVVSYAVYRVIAFHPIANAASAEGCTSPELRHHWQQAASGTLHGQGGGSRKSLSAGGSPGCHWQLAGSGEGCTSRVLPAPLTGSKLPVAP